MVPQQFLVLLGRQQPLSLGQYRTTTMSMRLPVNKGSCKVKGIPKSLKTSHINHCDSIRYYHCAQIPVQETVLSLEKKKKAFHPRLFSLHTKRNSCLICNRIFSPLGVCNLVRNNRPVCQRPHAAPSALQLSARHLHWKKRVRGLMGKIHTFIDTGQKMEWKKREKKALWCESQKQRGWCDGFSVALCAICLNLGPQDCSYLCLHRKTISLHIVIMPRCLGFDFREQCWPFVYCQFHEGEHFSLWSQTWPDSPSSPNENIQAFYFVPLPFLFLLQTCGGNRPNSVSAYITLTVPFFWQRHLIVSVFSCLSGGLCSKFGCARTHPWINPLSSLSPFWNGHQAPKQRAERHTG